MNQEGNYLLGLWEPGGNTWMGFRNDPNIEKVGDGILKLHQDSMTLEYALKSGSVEGSRVDQLVRLR